MAHPQIWAVNCREAARLIARPPSFVTRSIRAGRIRAERRKGSLIIAIEELERRWGEFPAEQIERVCRPSVACFTQTDMERAIVSAINERDEEWRALCKQRFGWIGYLATPPPSKPRRSTDMDVENTTVHEKQFEAKAKSMLFEYAVSDLAFYCQVWRSVSGLDSGMVDRSARRERLRHILNDLKLARE